MKSKFKTILVISMFVMTFGIATSANAFTFPSFNFSPAVYIFTPISTANYQITGESVYVSSTFSAYDFDGYVTRVYVKLDGGSWIYKGSGTGVKSHGFTFGTINLGPHTIYVRAYDNDGAYRTVSRSFTVSFNYGININFDDGRAIFAALKDIAQEVIDSALPVGETYTIGPYVAPTEKASFKVKFELYRSATNTIQISLVDSSVTIPGPYNIDFEFSFGLVVDVTISSGSITITLKRLEAGAEAKFSLDITTAIDKLIDTEMTDGTDKTAIKGGVKNLDAWGAFDSLPKFEVAAGKKLTAIGTASTTFSVNPGDDPWTGSLTIKGISFESYYRLDIENIGGSMKTNAIRDHIISVLNKIPSSASVTVRIPRICFWRYCTPSYTRTFTADLSSYKSAIENQIKNVFNTASFAVTAELDLNSKLTAYKIDYYDILTNSPYAKLYVGQFFIDFDAELSFSIGLRISLSISTPNWIRNLGGPSSVGYTFSFSESQILLNVDKVYTSPWLINGITITPFN
ncbi:MAG: hypothetical protein HeimC3_08570 [Candidatus Heimdallarchaeota archaeon LC_3]|nr:MAG: hypothetical protein HeimC3_24220 [Candidatus Heimdallarchaeota archaeon LC_3]OLS26538.1 MAG: hypothetical protein HeimC3_08570 [Candidatus Heimdallarchaeota archaeon LC_3]